MIDFDDNLFSLKPIKPFNSKRFNANDMLTDKEKSKTTNLADMLQEIKGSKHSK